MEKLSTSKKQALKKLSSDLKRLQEELTEAKKQEGIDEYIEVKIKKDQAHFERVKTKDGDEKAAGNFLIVVEITAEKDTVFIPISISSGIKPTGFMYQIEGTAPGAISTASVICRGEGVTQVTLGTLLYAKIPLGKTAIFRIQTKIKGSFGKTYKIIINRINYKLKLPDARYTQYRKEIISDSVKLS